MTENTKDKKQLSLIAYIKRLYQKFGQVIDIGELNIVHCIICFLLSRSSISGELFSCAIAFLTAYFYVRGPSAVMLVLSVLGIISVRVHFLYIAMAILIYVYFVKFEKQAMKNIFSTSLLFSLALFTFNMVMLLYGGFNVSILLIKLVEILFIVSSAYIFKEAILCVDNKSINKSPEAVCCVLIVTFLAVLGFNRVSILGLDILETMKYLTIVMTAVYFGPVAGMTIGAVFGAFGYYDLSQAAFYMIALASGALSTGALRGRKKVYSPLVFIIVSSLLLMYFKSLYLYEDYVIELGISGLIFVILYLSLNKRIVKLFSSESQAVEKDETYNKLTKLSDAINEISVAYKEEVESNSKPSNLIENAVNAAYGNVCMECERCNACWKKNYNKTYYAITKTANNIARGKNIADKYIKNECIRSKDILRTIYKTIKKPDDDEVKQNEINRSKEVVASSLKQTSEILNEAANEILYVDIASAEAKDRIREMLLKNNIKLKYIEAYKQNGQTKLKFSINTSKTLSAAVGIITDAVREVTGINVKCTEKLISSGTYYILQFEELEKINVKAYYSKLAKENNDISGDSYSYGSCKDRFYSILCDGMGTGVKASKDSREAIELLGRLFEADFNEKRMLNTVNSLLLLKFEDDRYVTLDMAVVDYEAHELRLYKAGAAPTYIISDKEVKKYESNSLPIGILDEFEYYYDQTPTKKGDLVIMMTDGVLDSINESESKSIEKYIENIKSEDPQTIANSLLAYAVSGCTQIIDDMTILVLKIV